MEQIYSAAGDEIRKKKGNKARDIGRKVAEEAIEDKEGRTERKGISSKKSTERVVPTALFFPPTLVVPSIFVPALVSVFCAGRVARCRPSVSSLSPTPDQLSVVFSFARRKSRIVPRATLTTPPSPSFRHAASEVVRCDSRDMFNFSIRSRPGTLIVL
ncbi:hypothetical protein K0M31_013517 [Melipona bicolor]|uniref:Uncharacterized protein n=1 Tax=Melipona bicolor TaxID=60889 RepID=A0AA40KGI1_9HYME|nr:hypothetical protein K0M31_013517 [Melipona bicolor]